MEDIGDWSARRSAGAWGRRPAHSQEIPKAHPLHAIIPLCFPSNDQQQGSQSDSGHTQWRKVHPTPDLACLSLGHFSGTTHSLSPGSGGSSLPSSHRCDPCTRVFKRTVTEQMGDRPYPFNQSPSAPFGLPRSDSDCDSPLSTPGASAHSTRFLPGSFQPCRAEQAGMAEGGSQRVCLPALVDRESARYSPKNCSGGIHLRKQVAMKQSLRSNSTRESLDAPYSSSLQSEHVEAKCSNFTDVLNTCATREKEEDLDGIEIVTIMEDNGGRTTTEVLYALYFSRRPTLPVLPGDECTRLLFPQTLQVAARGGEACLQPHSIIAATVHRIDDPAYRGGRRFNHTSLGPLPGASSELFEFDD